MASFPPNSDPTFTVTITQEEFNLFHNIDRQLFTRLVVGLGRDTTKSTHVMAFILWVENKIKNRNTVSNLLKWPDVMLSKLADEIELVLDCIDNSTFPYGSYSQKFVPLIQTIMHNTVTLHYFHNNRIQIITGITKLLNEVCLRAFTDIVQQVHYTKAMKEQNMCLANVYGGILVDPSMQVQPQLVNYSPGATLVPQQVLVPQWNEESSNARNTTYDVSRQVHTNEDISNIFANLDLDSGFVDPDAVAHVGSAAIVVPVGDEQRNMAMDDRTIFMTFSKGYRISELEVREFFTRKYGDVVEAMFMQDVQPPEQPLYARLVVYPEAEPVIEDFLGGKNGKLKFAINGKHVWARKFIRKAPTSPNEVGTSHF